MNNDENETKDGKNARKTKRFHMFFYLRKEFKLILSIMNKNKKNKNRDTNAQTIIIKKLKKFEISFKK